MQFPQSGRKGLSVMRLPRPKLTIRRLMAVVAVVGIGLGASLWAIRSPVVIVEPAPRPQATNSDHDILDVVLSDLLKDTEISAAVHPRGGKRIQIEVENTTAGSPELSIDSVCLHSKQAIPAEIRTDLETRNPRGRQYHLVNYRPSNPDIVVKDPERPLTFDEFRRGLPPPRARVHPLLPGYSRDGQQALFCFLFSPSPHGAAGCYFLKKVNGRWEIVWKQISFFT